MNSTKLQLNALFVLVLINGFLAFLTIFFKWYRFFGSGMDYSSLPNVPDWILGLINAIIVIFLYGGLGFLGYKLARKSDLPGIFSDNHSKFQLYITPLLIGSALGIFLALFDKTLMHMTSWSGFPHPKFPVSVVASASAGIGEEILYRLFFLSLWAFLLGFVFSGKSRVRYWLANLVAALIFAAAHFPGAMMILKVSNFSQLPIPAVIELVFLNALVGLIAGGQFIQKGLVAAVGIHFWTDIVWHVIYPILS